MKTTYKTFEARVKAGLAGEAKLADIEADILAADLLPLANSKGVIDTKSPGFKALQGRAYKVASAWYTSEARVIDGKVYEPAALKAAIDKKGTAHPARDGALSGIRVKAFRWTGKLVKAHEAAQAAIVAAQNGSGRATSGKVAVALKRSKAAKGKAAPAKAGQSVPELIDALGKALAALKPQARIVAATNLVATAQGWVNLARTEMDGKPRVIAKAAKRAKAATQAAPVAVQ